MQIDTVRKDQEIATSIWAHKKMRNDALRMQLRKAVVAFFMSRLTTKKEFAELQRVFKFLDKNGDGLVAKEEMKDGYRML